MDEMERSSDEPRATLIVTPKSTIPGWQKQIETHIRPDKVRLLIYHGSKRRQANQAISHGHDIVLTTYETLRSDWVNNNGIYSDSWYRIVLDEAHHIRNRSSQAFKAASLVRAHFCWGLTGTPIHNSLEDYGALLSFIGVPLLKEKPAFDFWIASPVKEKQAHALRTLQYLVTATALRRTKAILNMALELPQKHEKIESVQLGSTDRALYNFFKARASKTATQLSGKKDVTEVTEDKKENTLTLINIMRLICNHGKCLLSPTAVQTWESREDIYSTTHGKIISDNVGRPILPSAKVQALLKNLQEELNSNIHGTSKPAKSVIFSQWTKMLDLIEQALRRENIGCERIDGQSSLADRERAITKLNENRDCRVMLASIGSAGEGVNLTSANHVHLIEPHWNPMVEAQAVDRVHRIGQTRSVEVTRYITSDSIENYVRWIQQDKMKVIMESLGSNTMTQPELEDRRWKKLQSLLGKQPVQ